MSSAHALYSMIYLQPNLLNHFASRFKCPALLLLRQLMVSVIALSNSIQVIDLQA